VPRVAVAIASGLAALIAPLACAAPTAAGPPPLGLERTIPLAGVAGRIDHLAIDAARARLFVAELGNGSVEAVDLRTGRSLGSIAGLQAPQGIGYLAARDELAVSTGGDGMLRFYRAADLRLTGAVKLGDDADDVRVDEETGHIVVAFGKALAVIDPATRKVLATVPLPAHPEGFETRAGRAYVNAPNAGATFAVDLRAGREIARWRNPGAHFNFPLALDPASQLIATVFRLPAKVVLRDAVSGQVLQQLDACGDADDAFFDAPRARLYVVCGGGSVDVFQSTGTRYARAARIPTRGGARTGLFSPKLDRLYVAARATGEAPAAILVLRPM
jgi:hypothetical protein